jgi:hypothetical protein
MKNPGSEARLVWVRPTSPSSTPSEQSNWTHTSNTELADSRERTEEHGSEPYLDKIGLESDSDIVPKLTSSDQNLEDTHDSDDPPKIVCKYKKVAQKVRPMIMQIPEELKP